ncbi:signal transduction histidine kinase [Actinocrispum wychmicini]|uniref:histidine kinase n=2 Tax=Actinocrispum wychmicini TaxID=1213861 RepID=A0A4R2JPV0_9PSEU|nr:signal transduction histidine kinase [Actinocrispum wychmicini]
MLREDLLTDTSDRHGHTPRWLSASATLVFTLLAAALFAATANEYGRADQLGTFGYPVAAVLAMALVVTLYRPIVAWWMVTAVDGVLMVLAITGTSPTWTGVEIAMRVAVLFMVALRSRPRVTAETLGISVSIEVIMLFAAERDRDIALTVTILVATVVVGASLRGRQVARDKLVEREKILAEGRTQLAHLQERNRIARELHDVVAHHMSVISIQAQVATHLVENPPEALTENLAGIRDSAVEALTELRRVLGVLRSEEALQAEDTRYAPQPSLDQLDELILTVRRTGLAVTTQITGDPRPLPSGVELSAYRIVQEALSNVLRHAPGAAARVEIGYQRSEVTIRVANTAPTRPGTAAPGQGHGLLGMRERTAMLGGALTNGATPDGGYDVTATLPTTTTPAEDTP